MVGAEPVERHVDALCDPPGREIEMCQVVAAQFRAEQITVPRDVFERHPKEHLAHTAAVERARVDQVHAALEGRVDAADRLFQRDGAKLLPQRTGAEGEDRDIEAGVAEWAGVHVVF